MWQWWNGIISGEIIQHVNQSIPFLIEKTILQRQGHLSCDGALVVNSGKFTGRAAEDKYIVVDDYSERVIDWSGKVSRMEQKVFQDIKTEILKKFHLLKPEIFIQEVSAGADKDFSLGVHLLTPSPQHALFCQLIMRPKREVSELGTFTIYHDPQLELSPHDFGLRSSTIIALNFMTKEILIAGTAYCGEIKKAIFTVLNTLLPDKNVLPMHSGANMDLQGKVSVFFGLSGTGKTSLATDTGMALIGDDEHGLSDKGIFNFEGGCYAKTYKLKFSSEPEIYKATNRFGSLIENVILDSDTRRPIFDNPEITENGRSTYPLHALENIVSSGMSKIPSNFFFLSADALGVLPLVSKLDEDQVLYYFLLGYTARVAGTEAGMKEISATFSHCFGAPFMMRRPYDYGRLLQSLIRTHSINVWLVNTGWYGGPFGVGSRYDLSITRACIRAIQAGEGEIVGFKKDEVFSLSIPEKLKGLDSHYLMPERLWENREKYFDEAKKLRSLFDERFEKFRGAE